MQTNEIFQSLDGLRHSIQTFHEMLNDTEIVKLQETIKRKLSVAEAEQERLMKSLPVDALIRYMGTTINR